NAIAVQAGDLQIGRERLRSGVDDGPLRCRRRYHGSNYGERAVLKALTAESDLVCVAIDIGTRPHLGDSAAQGEAGRRGRADAQFSNLDPGLAQHVSGRRDAVGLLVGCQLTFVLVGGGIDVAAVSDESAKALWPD